MKPSRKKSLEQTLLATLPPVFALLVQWLLWPYIRPYVWFLFFPAVFISSWIGGRLAALWATALSVAFVWLFFVPPEHTITLQGLRILFPSAIFVAMGLTFGAFHERLNRALGAARQANEDLVRAQAVAKIGSWRIDGPTQRLHWSPETYRICGVPLGTPMTYPDFLATVHADDRERVEQAWTRALQGQAFSVEHRLRQSEGARWVSEVAELQFDGTGALREGLGTIQDITERKSAEAALARSHDEEKRLRTELEDVTRAGSAISEAVADLPKYDLSTVLHIIALQAQALTHAEYVALGLGTDPEQRLDPWISIGFDSDTLAKLGPGPHPVGTLGLVAREAAFIRVDDVRRHPHFLGFPKGHPEIGSFLGVPIRYRGAVVGNLFLGRRPSAAAFTEHDERLVSMFAARAGVAIETATLYAGEALQRAWLQTIIDQMPEAVVFVDEHGQVVLQNPAARALGVSAQEPPRLDLRRPDGKPLPATDDPLERAITHGESVLGEELAVVGPAGDLMPMLASATPVRVGDHVAGAVGVFQDIRSLKELERLREEWASMIAHDLRQPVSSITLGTSLLYQLRRDAMTAPERAMFERVRSASARLNRMIGDLLDSSRLEARRLSLERSAVDLDHLVEEIVDHFRLDSPGFQFRVTGEPGQVAWLDLDRIHQVLENLFSNAVKYGEPGTEIRVELKPRDEWIEVAITNHGPGIPADELPLLFNRFSRTRDARVGRAPGLGLGLYISRGLVEAHGGRLWAESTPGQTTCFHFTVPRVLEGRTGVEESASGENP